MDDRETRVFMDLGRTYIEDAGMTGRQLKNPTVTIIVGEATPLEREVSMTLAEATNIENKLSDVLSTFRSILKCAR